MAVGSGAVVPGCLLGEVMYAKFQKDSSAMRPSGAVQPAQSPPSQTLSKSSIFL